MIIKLIFLLSIFQLVINLESDNDNQQFDDDENSKCTEHKGIVHGDFLLHVPCLLIRIMENLKKCPVKSYVNTFLGMKTKFKYLQQNLIIKVPIN